MAVVEYSAFEVNLRQIEERTGMLVTAVDLRGVFRMLRDLRLSAAIQEHRGSFCQLAKATGEGWALCNRNKRCASHMVLRSPGGRSAACRLGLTEHVEVMRVDNVDVAIFYLGQAVCVEGEKAARDKMLAATAGQADAARVQDSFENVQRKSQAEYSAAVRQLRAVLAMAKAVIEAEALPLRELTVEVSGVQWSVLREQPTLIRRALLIIDRTPLEHLTVQRLAESLGCGREHLSRVFRQAMRVSPGVFIRQHKLERARHLLINMDYSLSEVAYQCGFADASHFSRSFQAAFKLTPKRFREQSRN